MNLIAHIISSLESLQFTENIFLVDILDVVIIAFFIYLGLFFLKQTRSLVTFAGIISLILIYFPFHFWGRGTHKSRGIKIRVTVLLVVSRLTTMIESVSLLPSWLGFPWPNKSAL